MSVAAFKPKQGTSKALEMQMGASKFDKTLKRAFQKSKIGTLSLKTSNFVFSKPENATRSLKIE